MAPDDRPARIGRIWREMEILQDGVEKAKLQIRQLRLEYLRLVREWSGEEEVGHTPEEEWDAELCRQIN